jgi:hypothetical protein
MPLNQRGLITVDIRRIFGHHCNRLCRYIWLQSVEQDPDAHTFVAADMQEMGCAKIAALSSPRQSTRSERFRAQTGRLEIRHTLSGIFAWRFRTDFDCLFGFS